MTDLSIKIDVPNKGMLELKYSIDDVRLFLYKGPLAQLSITTPTGPEAKYSMPSDDFIVLLAQFFKRLSE